MFRERPKHKELLCVYCSSVSSEAALVRAGKMSAHPSAWHLQSLLLSVCLYLLCFHSALKSRSPPLLSYISSLTCFLLGCRSTTLYSFASFTSLYFPNSGIHRRQSRTSATSFLFSVTATIGHLEYGCPLKSSEPSCFLAEWSAFKSWKTADLFQKSTCDINRCFLSAAQSSQK